MRVLVNYYSDDSDDSDNVDSPNDCSAQPDCPWVEQGVPNLSHEAKQLAPLLNPEPRELRRRLVRILALEGVKDPDVMVTTIPLGALAYGALVLYRARERTAQVNHGGGYLMGIALRTRPAPELLDYGFLRAWDDAPETGGLFPLT